MSTQRGPEQPISPPPDPSRVPESHQGAPPPPHASDADRPQSDRIYTPEPGESQLTLRAVLAGGCLGVVVASMNIYFGLKTGWSIGGSLIAAILGYAVFAVLVPMFKLRPYTVLETNITQTSGSAAGCMASAAGLLSAIPALGLLGVELSYLELTAWAFAVAYLGVFFAVPLRRQMVVVEKLRFPTGTATAETIVSMFAKGGDAIAQAKMLLVWGIAAALFTLLGYFLPPLLHPPLDEWLAEVNPDLFLTIGLATAAAWGFSLLISPLMFGAGLLIGPRVGISLLLGAIVSWAVLAPIASSQGWTTGPIMSYESGPRGWILWPGVAIMVADALTNLALSWRTVLNTFLPGKGGGSAEMESAEDRVPNSWWIGGIAAATTLTVVVAWLVFDIPWYLTLIGVAMSSILSMIAVRSVGETDINPTGGMGKVSQLAFGALAPGSTTTNILGAGITSAGASQAGDMMQDLKTGRMLGATPRKQIIAQCLGIPFGIAVTVPIFVLFSQAYEMGGQELPAPAAQAWRAMAVVLAEGFSALPTHATWAVLAGALFGITMAVVRKLAGKHAKYIPSGLAFGIAFIVPAYYSVAMFLGSMMLVLWRQLAPKHAAIFAFAVASGLVAGEGLMGVVNAVLTLLNIPTLV